MLCCTCAHVSAEDVETAAERATALKRRTVIGLRSLVPLSLSERESRFIGDVLRAR
jgi:hypothetical protein